MELKLDRINAAVHSQVQKVQQPEGKSGRGEGELLWHSLALCHRTSLSLSPPAA